MIQVNKGVWVQAQHIAKVKKCDGGTKIYLCDGTVEVLDTSLITTEVLVQMLEGGK